MKTFRCTLIAFTGFALLHCGGPSATETQPAGVIHDGLIAASSETAANVGIATWEIVRDGAGTRVLGRGAAQELLADLETHSDPAACGTEGGVVVATKATLPAPGTRAIGCGGNVLSDSLDPLTRRTVDLLFADLASLPPAAGAAREVEAFATPILGLGTAISNPTPGICAPHTDAKCYGVVLWCKDTHADCSTSSHVCGVCLGFPF